MEASGDLGKRGFSGGVVLKEGLGWTQGRIQGKVSSFQAFCLNVSRWAEQQLKGKCGAWRMGGVLGLGGSSNTLVIC